MLPEAPVELTREAATDLLWQAEWYDTHAGPEVAERYLRAVAGTRDRLSLTPDAGRRRRFSSPLLRGVRSLAVERPFHRHLFFFRREDAVILILRIMHGARDLPRRLLEAPGSEDA